MSKNVKKEDGFRPVSARALTSVMDTLRPELADSSVLDLFAGEGRFGRSALDEGAAAAYFVEKDRKRATGLTDALKKDERATVICKDALTFLAETGETFDIAFVDPPFDSWNTELAEALSTGLHRVVTSILLVKTPSRMVVFAPSRALWKPWKETRFGESKLLYFTHEKRA